MGLFGELDVESAADDPFEVPPNVYNALLTEVKVGPTKDQTKVGMTLVFKIQSEDEHNGKLVREWKHIPQPADPHNLSAEDQRSLSFLKSRLMDLGIPAAKVNEVEPDDLVGKEVTITVKLGKNNFTNVSKVTLLQDVPVAAGAAKKKFK
jgi:hypothetical protein